MDPRIWFRVARVALTLVAVGLAAYPLWVMLDLAAGGTGRGLCPGGVTTCRNPYSAAPALSAVLTIGLILVLGGFRIVTHLEQRARRQRLPST